MGWGEGCIEDVLQLQLSILSQVGVYFLGRGTNRRLWAAQQPEASFVGGDIFRQSTSDGSTQPSPPNLENGTYVRQEQQIGETYTNHGATAANW